MSKSLRWTLLTWHAASLAGVVIAFVLTVWLAVEQSTREETDRQLRSQAGALAASLVSLDDGRFALELSQSQAGFFTRGTQQGLFYVLWSRDGSLIDMSHPELEVPRLKAPGRRTRGPWRELSLPGPSGTTVLVGRNIQGRQRDLQRLLGVLIGVASLSIFLGLASGWFVTGRALAPIARITRAASEITPSNPSQRIDLQRMEAELHELGATINGAFDRLQQALQRQTCFTEDASHELRTPLAIIVSQVEFALKGDRPVSEYRESLQVIQRATNRMRSIVTNLLSLAALDANGDDRDQTPVPLDDIVQDACNQIAPWAKQQGMDCIVELEPLWIEGDRQRLTDLVLNLVSNAVRYNRPRGTIRVQLARNGIQALLRVSDTGTGIPQADQPYVFERFYRVDKARSRSAGGSGLGLAIAKQIAEIHGGRISVEKTSQAGTTILVCFRCCSSSGEEKDEGGRMKEEREEIRPS